jgi:glutamate synthase (NADPH) small chain
MPEANPIPLKERMQIPRVLMPELDAEMRAHNFDEVNLGLAAAGAVTEATRCIACAKPGCQLDCPVGVKIKEIVALICAGDFLGAAKKMREDNALPAITGRVCPQESQCEGGCVVGKKGSLLPSATSSGLSPTSSGRAASSDCRRLLLPPARAWPS